MTSYSRDCMISLLYMPTALRYPTSREQKMARVLYDIAVQTQRTGGAGYDGTIYVTIIGSSGQTDAMALDKVKWFRDDFGEGGEESFSMEAADVGDMYAIKLSLSNPQDQWNPGLVKISKKKDGTAACFPCYQWVTTDITVREAKATLPFQDNAKLKEIRSEEIKKWQDLLPWHKWESLTSYPDYPSHDDLPRDLQFASEKQRDMNDYKKEGVWNFLLEKFVGIFKEVESFFDYTKFFKMGVGDDKVPAVSHNWQTDREFGRQFLQGVHPTMLRRVENKLPAKFPVTDHLVRGSLGHGVTLQQAIDYGHIYMVDYEMLVGIPIGKDRYVTPAMGLFYVNAAGFLMPIAIQFDQEPGPGNPIWTPDDFHDEWLLAKLWLRCADAQIHEILGHLLRTHLVMEPVFTALLRNVARCHPIFKLLIPHMRYTIAINTLGRITLVGAGGFVDKGMAVGGGGHLDLIKRGYRNFDWRLLNVPHALKERKVEDVAKLPRYYYRDDAMNLWDAMMAFIKEVVKIYYSCDGEVRKDTELQAFMKDLHDNGLVQHGLEGEVDHHVPKSLESVKELIEWLTCVIFCCSAQHAAENFGQFDYYAYNPNAPMIMRQPPPTKKGEVNAAHVLKSIGTTTDACVQIAATWTLAAFSEDEVFLGNYPEHHFKEEATIKAIEGFQSELSRIDAEIDQRNGAIEVPYIYLKPSRVPNSIAV
eukprot:m.213385 g.213385  ORF g.213385 m.213385 type:complete len:702 (+) comp39785_c0_seq1:3-2108(+)